MADGSGGSGGSGGERLSEGEIRQRLDRLPDWRHFADALHKEFRFRGFRAAIGFVNRMAEQATAKGHHPDIEIHVNRVIVSLTSHEAGGVTEKDVELAAAIDSVAEPDA
jgi:4a-hydroxytetrahydrobiopterin dehydratase